MKWILPSKVNGSQHTFEMYAGVHVVCIWMSTTVLPFAIAGVLRAVRL